jgi:predicted alpha/beta-fold hydrolase
MIYNNQTFKPKYLFKNKHFNTVYRYVFNNLKINYKRERLLTKDKDFLDLDFSKVNSNKLVIALHGLEGSSNSSYIKSLTKVFNDNNYDVVIINLRSCSGESNNLLSSYHSGKTEDLNEVIEHINKKYHYKKIHVVGYSLGGNITLKFMGEAKENTVINSAVAVSVPCSLKGSSIAISQKGNKMYLNNFLKTLKDKTFDKIDKFPDAKWDIEKINAVKTFKDFDDVVTAPTNGFKDAYDYYSKASSKQFLQFIKKPTLLITALDDPFLNEDCYPIEIAKNSKHFHILTTKYGGHVGFCHSFNMKKNIWLENQILSFIKSNN